MTLREVARVANIRTNYPLETWSRGSQDSAVYDPTNFACSNGAHVCELEVDPETGEVEHRRLWGVDDVGTVINPMIVEGQIHGGVAQGIGQALLRAMRLRRRQRPAAVGLVHGLRDAARRRHARHRHPSSTRASPAPTTRSAPRAAARPARSARPPAIVERGARRAGAARRHRHRDAGDAASSCGAPLMRK